MLSRELTGAAHASPCAKTVARRIDRFRENQPARSLVGDARREMRRRQTFEMAWIYWALAIFASLEQFELIRLDLTPALWGPGNFYWGAAAGGIIAFGCLLRRAPLGALFGVSWGIGWYVAAGQQDLNLSSNQAFVVGQLAALGAAMYGVALIGRSLVGAVRGVSGDS